jgi:hypothetical protein
MKGARTAVDSALVGAWARSRLVVDGMRCADRCDVLWLQTPDWYADIRLPSTARVLRTGGPEVVFARPVAFAGLACWNPPMMTWRRHLDSMCDQISDCSRLHFEGDILVETGCLKWAGLTIPFREEWRRISVSQAEMSAQIDPDRIAITLGTWRIVVEEERPPGIFRAARHDFEGGSWRLRGSIVEAPPPTTARAGPPVAQA